MFRVSSLLQQGKWNAKCGFRCDALKDVNDGFLKLYSFNRAFTTAGWLVSELCSLSVFFCLAKCPWRWENVLDDAWNVPDVLIYCTVCTNIWKISCFKFFWHFFVFSFFSLWLSLFSVNGIDLTVWVPVVVGLRCDEKMPETNNLLSIHFTKKVWLNYENIFFPQNEVK